MKTMYVYILHCADDSFYIGVTNNIERRFLEHQQGIHEGSYTSYRRPVELVYYEEFDGPLVAIAREKQLKNWSRAKKLALIQAHERELKNLAKKKF
ncbi:MAG: endonuclease [Bacteroidetes bacterium CG2_30_33_31]|nr:MAG: endonuclease [Bacteroidetes bacterium CG2_30_33_31]